MPHPSSWPLRVAYIGTLLGILLPIGLSASGWVALSMGRGGHGASWMYAATALYAIVGIWRIWIVAAERSALDSPATAGALRAARIAGVICLYVGAVVFVLNLVGRPLVRAFVSRPSENGVEFFVAGMYLAILGGIGLLGLILFEFSRLRAFEKGRFLADS